MKHLYLRASDGAVSSPVRRAWSLLAPGLLTLMLTVAPWGSGLAQAGNSPLEGETPTYRSEDILIEGLGFSRLNLAVETDPALESRETTRKLTRLVEKNLCWSGLFTLFGGRSGYCAGVGQAPRIDMRVQWGMDGQNLWLRLLDNGPERLVLFNDTLTNAERITEDELMDAINRLAQRVTGEYGLLGSTIAFVMKQPGYAKVVVATTTHGERKRLITRNEFINLLPRFSPDGGALVYTVLGRDGSQVMFHDLLGGLQLPLTDTGSLNTGGAFSPDGDKLVLTVSTRGNADLFSVDISQLRSTRQAKLAQLTDRLGIETQADWAPDGHSLVFVSDRSGSPQIYLYDLATGQDLRLTFDGVYNVDPKWSPDGRHILFTSRLNVPDPTTGVTKFVDRIMIMDPYGENIRPVTGGRFDSEQAEWSPDGNQIIFTSKRTPVYKLYVVSADGQFLRRLTDTSAAIEETSPTWTRRHLIR